LPALQADLESRRAQRDAIYSSIEAAREELRKLTPKTMSMAPRIEIDVIGGRATVEPMR
jgi:hypothetical protein